MQILISQLLDKLADLDLHYLQGYQNVISEGNIILYKKRNTNLSAHTAESVLQIFSNKRT